MNEVKVPAAGHDQLLRQLQHGFALLGCFFFGTNLFDIFFGDGPGAPVEGGGRLWLQLSYMAMYVIAALFLILRKGALLSIGIGVVALSLFPFISLYWSINPTETLRRGVALFGTCVFGAFLGACFSGRELVRLLAITYAVIGLISLMIVVAVPAIGIHSDPIWAGAWRGLYLHKNGLGGAAAFGSIIMIIGIVSNKGALRLLLLAGLGCMLVLLMNAMSTTGYVVFAVLLACVLWALLAQWMPEATIVFTTSGIAILVALLVGASGDGALISWELLGKSSDMSGRIPLWMLSWESIMRAPLLGYGYAAFWSVDTLDVNRMEHVLHYRPFYAHNGFIEILLGGGFVLFSMYLISHAVILFKSILLIFIDRGNIFSSFPFIFAVYFVFSNLTESTMLAYNNLIWALFCAVLVFLGRRITLRL